MSPEQRAERWKRLALAAEARAETAEAERDAAREALRDIVRMYDQHERKPVNIWEMCQRARAALGEDGAL